jgi:CMP/dCMP kinase
MIITIDGPAVSGKSTLGRMLAKNLGYYYLYSGLLFRALAYLLINKGGYREDDLRNPHADDVTKYLDPEKFIYQYNEQFKESVFFDGIDITPHLKNHFMDKMASIIGTNKSVRDFLANFQRHIAQKNPDIVVDGRDEGSIVFPAATIKFFLTALLEVRAERWRHEQKKIGNDVSQEQAMVMLRERDERDKNREADPLIIPDDAMIVDNSYASPEDILKQMLTLMNRKLNT